MRLLRLANRMTMRWAWLGLVVAGWSLGPGWCAGADRRPVILASTTSLCDSGLLDELGPRFTAQSGYLLKPVCVGSGQALALGSRGEADAIIAHAPQAETAFVAAGHAESVHPLMSNDFILVGPRSDPAAIADLAPAAALGRIALRGALFVSRGDGSGTEERELELWRAAGVRPEGSWYLRAGQGMAATLRLVSEKRGYTLSDRSTFRTLERMLDLKPLVEDHPGLANVYRLLVVDRARHPGVNIEGARALDRFFASIAVQNRIADFGRGRYGAPLFVPAAAPLPAARP